MADNKELCSYLYTLPPKVSWNASVEGSPPNTDWDGVHLWKQDGELYIQCLGCSLDTISQSSGLTCCHHSSGIHGLVQAAGIAAC